MLKKITLKGIRDSFSSKFALSPSRSTGTLDNVVSTVVADDEDDDDDDDDIEGSLHLRRNYPLTGSPRTAAASELNLGPRNEGPRKSLVQSLRYRIKSRKRLPLSSQVKVQAAQSYVPDRGAVAHHPRGGGGLDANGASSLRRADTMRDAHDNVLYSDVATDGTIVRGTRDEERDRDEDDDDDDDVGEDVDDDGAERANNAIYDLAARVTASQSADSLLSDATSAFHDADLRNLQRQQRQKDVASTSSHASCVGDTAAAAATAATAATPTQPSATAGVNVTGERKALPRMGAKTLKLKSPSSSCISRGAVLTVAAANDASVDAAVGKDAAVVASNDSLPSPALTGGAEEKMKESMTDSGCSIDATPVSPTETSLKQVFRSEMAVGKSVSSPHLPSHLKPVQTEIGDLMNHGWYWGPISRTEADSILNQESEGSFLVRDSSDPSRYLLSLSFKSTERVLHTRIQHDNGLYFFYHQPRNDGYASIPALIEHSMEDSLTGSVFCYRPPSTKASTPTSDSPPSLHQGAAAAAASTSAKQPVRLITPISRLSHVRSLTAICKFEMKQTGLRAEA